MTDACRHPETEARREWAERWLSQSRLPSYLDLCSGDIDKALVFGRPLAMIHCGTGNMTNDLVICHERQVR